MQEQRRLIDLCVSLSRLLSQSCAGEPVRGKTRGCYLLNRAASSEPPVALPAL
jgi:hypothetical protein